MARVQRWRGLAVELVAVGGVGVIVALLSPFGVLHHEPAGVRLVYWLRTLLLGYLVFRPLWVAAGPAGRRLGAPGPLSTAVATAVGAVPLAAALWWLGPRIDLHRRGPTAAEYLQTYLQVLLLAGLCLGALALWRQARREDAPGPGMARGAPEAQAPEAGLLFERLPARLGRTVVTVMTEDHYLRVRTEAGEALVLMRMADAEQSLAGLDDLRVHRSWWVARGAVAREIRRGRSWALILSDGRRIPVARNRVPALVAAGWLNQSKARRATIRPTNRAAIDSTTDRAT